jgi:hypothetical protein
MRKRLVCQALLFVLFIVLILNGSQSAPAYAADITGDFVSDLIISVPHEDTTTIVEAGAVATLLGAKGAGLTAADQLIYQSDSQEINETGDQFGYALTVGDFNRDHIFDVAVGVPFEDFGGLNGPGAVQVIYSTAGVGLDGTKVDFITQNNFSSLGSPAENFDNFGYSLTAGDFNGDGYSDLAIGVPYETLVISSVTQTDAGIVHVVYGSWEGLNYDFTQSFYQNFLAGGEVAESYDHFGLALSSGDFNGDGKDDLVIGVPEEDISYPSIINDVGALHIVYGHSGGLGAGGSELLQQTLGPVGDEHAEENDGFGAVLAAGDYNGDGHDDLTVGIPSESIGSTQNAGAVQVFFGNDSGISDTITSFFSQDITGDIETNDGFGFALTVGDFDGDGYDDLAIGIPHETLSLENVGIVHIIYGIVQPSMFGSQNQILSQGGANGGAQEAGDRFGYALAAGNFNGDRYDDLAVGVPYEDVGAIIDAGAVQVFYGDSSSLTNDGVQIWHQDTSGVKDVAEEDDQYGKVIVALPGIVFDAYLPSILK